MDLTGLSIIPFRLKQKKLLLFLSDTEQAIPIGMYIVTYLRIIKQSNFINKSVLEWRRRPQVLQNVALFWPFIKAAQKKQRLILEQGNDEQESSVMLQKQYSDMALKVNQLERFTNQLQGGVNNLIDKVQDDTSVQSRSKRSIPGVIDTDKSTSDSSDLSTVQSLILSLTASLVDAEKNQYIPQRDQRGPSGRVDGRSRSRGGREGVKQHP